MSPLRLIKADLYRYVGSYSLLLLIRNLFNSNRSFKYTFWLRLVKSENIIIRGIAKLMHRHLSIKYAIQIPKEVVIGPGLYLGHATSIIINPTAVLGKNCNLSQFTTIGSNHGKAAVIGGCCYIGPNVCLVEDVNIGDQVTIGAGSVVNKDVPSRCTAVGNPARIFPSKLAAKYIINPV